MHLRQGNLHEIMIGLNRRVPKWDFLKHTGRRAALTAIWGDGGVGLVAGGLEVWSVTCEREATVFRFSHSQGLVAEDARRLEMKC